MIRLLFTVGLVFGIMAVSAQDRQVNDPNAQVRNVEAFHGVNVSGAIELFVSQGPRKVVVSASEKTYVDEIITEVKGGVLHIRFKSEKSWWSDQWNTTGRKYRAYVSAEQFNKISLAGSGNIRIEGLLKADNLEVQLSGSGNILGSVDAQSLEIRQSGSGNTNLSGSVRRVEFNCSGSGNMNCFDLNSEDCEVRISGSGNAEVSVSRELSASISGSGNIRYKGTGNLVRASTAGSGKIRKI
jgi:hypothetical protein